MRLRSSRALIILLFLAAASPPPRESAYLLQAGRTFEVAGGVKTPQIRGRNRIPSQPSPDLNAVEGRLGTGDDDDDRLYTPAMAFPGPSRARRESQGPRPAPIRPVRPRTALPLRC